ncbi:MAG TPA: hypothetical protein VFY12_12220, partial [Arenimonas sp.]|nr:hypothetical protein [Arenimonas sp.]
SLQRLKGGQSFSPRKVGPEEDLDVFYRRQLLEAERQNYWNQFNLGLLDKNATTKLVEAVEVALDGQPDLGPRAKLQQLWSDDDWLEQLSHRLGLRQTRFRRLALQYATLRGYAQAQQTLLDIADGLAPDANLAAQADAAIEANLQQTQARAAAFRREHADTVTRLETYTALRLLLNRRRDAVHHLGEEGVLEPAETRKLIERVEHQMFKLARGGVL